MVCKGASISSSMVIHTNHTQSSKYNGTMLKVTTIIAQIIPIPGSKTEEMTIFTIFTFLIFLTFLIVVRSTRLNSFGLDQHLLVFFFTLLALLGIWKLRPNLLPNGVYLLPLIWCIHVHKKMNQCEFAFQGTNTTYPTQTGKRNITFKHADWFVGNMVPRSQEGGT